MQFEVFTLLPEIFPPYLESSILQRARQNGIINVRVHNIRSYTHNKHHTTDDVPYGGGGGMVMKPEPVFEAVESVLGLSRPRDNQAALVGREAERHEHNLPGRPGVPVILMTPQGRVFNQTIAQELSGYETIAVICGRYEGVDERIREHLVTDEISIGDYVLTGGELPALILIDAVARLLPGVLGDPDGAADDSHASGFLEYPHFTRPPEFRGESVPEVLLSGDHAKIAKWRREQSLLRTLERRPDLLGRAALSKEDILFLREHGFYLEG